MRRHFTGSAGEGLEGLGVRRAEHGRARTPVGAIIEDAPVFAGQTLSVRYSPHDWRTLWGAAALGQTRILTAILNRGAEIDSRDHEGRTALIYATDFRQPASLCLLLERGALPDITDPMGRTALFYLNGPQTESILTILLNGGANIDHRDERGHSILFRARAQGYGRLRRLLESAGAEIGFLEAIVVGDNKTAEGLPVNGDLDALLPNGETLLTRALRRGEFGPVALLLRRGAAPDRRDAHGETPLEVAASRSRGRLVRLLLDAGADPGGASLDTETLLHWAGIGY